MKKPIKNIAASIQGRLRHQADQTGRPYGELLDYYVMEKFLARLAASPHATKFILKGGLLFQVWQYPLRRPTRDIDLQASTDNSVEYVTALIKEICGQAVEPDGVEFDPALIRGQPINLQAATQGVRVRCEATFTNTKVKITFNVDVSFANVITPIEVEQAYPSQLANEPAFNLYTYPRETAIAEKLEAIVKLGVKTGRLNDFYDVFVLATFSAFQGAILSQAIHATFLNRGTPIPGSTPPSLTAEFAAAEQVQWAAYLDEFNQADSEAGDLGVVLERLRAFILPPMQAAAQDGAFNPHWPPGGPWQA